MPVAPGGQASIGVSCGSDGDARGVQEAVGALGGGSSRMLGVGRSRFASALADQLGAAVISLGFGAAAFLTWHNTSRRPVAMTHLDHDGVRVTSPGRPEAVARWVQVRGLRVFSRAVEPQLLLSDGAALGIPGLTSEQGRELAQWLARSRGRQIELEVDGRRVST